MKKYMIRCDMEGISGIVSYEQADPKKSEYQYGKKLFMSDLIAAVSGLIAGGADEVHIYDEHFFGRNIDLSEISSISSSDKIFVYMGKPPYEKDWAGGLTSDFDGLVLLGFHSKKGTKNALLNHTYENDIEDILVNGISVGEIGIETMIAKQMSVPLIMITADSEGVKEALQLEPEVIAVSVKESLGENSAICYPSNRTSQVIYDKAKEAAQRKWNRPVEDYKTGVHMKIRLADTIYSKEYLKMFSFPEFREKTVLCCWAKYWQNKLKVMEKL